MNIIQLVGSLPPSRHPIGMWSPVFKLQDTKQWLKAMGILGNPVGSRQVELKGSQPPRCWAQFLLDAHRMGLADARLWGGV